MKHNSKKILGLLLLVVALIGAMLVFGSCRDKNEVSEIYIQKADLPRVEYVEGQDLDISKGKLTVVVNGEETKLPLNAPEITVSGYDKEVVGKQTITVTYQELTTTFNVTVLERAVAENYESKYFVHSEFNPAKGKVRITPDEGKPFSVNMNDPKISLVDFDSSTPGTKTVTVLYHDGVNSYYCQFDVMVYEQSNIEFTAPKDTQYASHYTGLPSVNGGYFKVTSSDGTLTMNVPITESMIEGFDVSAATLANRTAPLEQKLTVNYLENKFYYSVYITYSGVSAIQHYAKGDLATIDWVKAEKDGFTDEQTASAISAITEYYALTDLEKNLIPDEMKALIAKAGAVAVNGAFYLEVATYQNSFKIDQDGKIYFIKSSYEQTLADVNRLNDPAEKLNVYTTLLRKIVQEFGQVMLTETARIADFVVVYSEEMEASLKGVLNHFVDVFALVKDIPADWTKDDLATYGDNLISVAMQIYAAGYYSKGAGAYYTSILSPWRENNDLIDIIYTYFLYVYENGSEFMTKYMWGAMPMPGLLENWYQGLKNCTTYSSYYKAYATAGQYCIDTTSYMYAYFQTLDICEQIKNSGNQFWIDIYNAYNGDNMNQVYMTAYTYGYLYFVGPMIDSPAVLELWDNYYTVLKLYNAKTLSAELHKSEIMALYQSMEKLTPTELLGFLSSLNLLYTSGEGKYTMLGYGIGTGENGEEKPVCYNVFSLILSNYFADYLTKDNKVLFNDLLGAMETFVLIGYKDGAREEFHAKMEALNTKLTALEGDARTNYEQYFQDLFKTYYAFYEVSADKVTPTLSEEETKLVEEFVETAEKYFVVYSTIYSILQQGATVKEDVYPILYSLYARLTTIRDALLATENAQFILSMNTKEYTVVNEVKYTIEHAYYLADSLTTTMLNNQSAIVSGAKFATYWDLFKHDGIEKFLSDTADILYFAYFKTENALEYADFTAYMNVLRNFNTMQSSIIVLLNIDDTFYHALVNYYATVLTAEGVATSEALVKVVNAYSAYTLGKTDENLVALFTAMDEATALYTPLTEADKTYLSDMYTYYSALVEALKTSSETENA